MLARIIPTMYASSSGTASGYFCDITLLYVVKHWIHGTSSVTGRLRRDGISPPALSSSTFWDQLSATISLISTNSHLHILSASFLGTGAISSPTKLLARSVGLTRHVARVTASLRVPRVPDQFQTESLPGEFPPVPT